MNAIRTISTVLMAVLLLVSSTSFMVGIHVCMGEVQSIAISANAERCAMERVPPCHSHAMEPCCDDKTVIHEADDFKVTAAQKQSAPLPVDIEPSLVLLSEIIPSTASFLHADYFDYDPPVRSCDLTVEHQVFLI